MRDYLIVCVILLSLPIGVVWPFSGLLVYTWVSYMYPQTLGWSFAQTFPAAKLTALAALAGTFFRFAGDTAPLRQRESISMILLWCVFTITSAFAFYPVFAWAKWQDVSKLIIMALLGSVLLTDPKRLRYFLLVIAFSLGFYGFKGGLFSLVTGGGHTIWGPGDSVLGANNSIGLALNSAL